MKQKISLHHDNLKAVHDVISHMRNDNRAISLSKFRSIFGASRGWRLRDHHLYQNYQKPIEYLEQQGLITTMRANNFTFYVLTQKALRTKIEKLFPKLYI